MRWKLAALSGLVPLLGLGLVAAALAAARSAPAPGPAVRAATRGIVARYRLAGLSDVTGIRSGRDRSYALVDGFFARPGRAGPWAVWLRYQGGSWRVIYAGIRERAVEPAVSVPCDLVPAFSEPSC